MEPGRSVYRVDACSQWIIRRWNDDNESDYSVAPRLETGRKGREIRLQERERGRTIATALSVQLITRETSVHYRGQ